MLKYYGNTTVAVPPKRKEDKEKENKRSEEEKIIPPSLNDIEKYIQEKKLSVNAKNFYDFFTEGNWTDSKGNKVKNWKQKILTWNGFSNNKQQESKANFEERQYTQEELKSLYANSREE